MSPPGVRNVEERLNRGGIVKICGLREPEHAAVAAVSGADLLGFVFAPARRRVTPDQARRCITAARDAVGPEGEVIAVGVFVDAAVDEIEETARLAGLDLVQLHGDEPPGFAAAITLPVMKVLKPLPSVQHEDVLADAATHQTTVPPPVAFLIDGYHPTSAGGAGVRADWRLASLVAARMPMLLAGGLTCDNVAQAIEAVRPLGVDVSSGVERDGVKDSERIAAFVVAAKAAFHLQASRAGSVTASHRDAQAPAKPDSFEI